MTYDVIIIGGGLSGLECGRLLSRAGRSVLIVERGHQVGGCLQSYVRHGLAYDTGFHCVGGLAEGQSLHAAFARLGLLHLPWHRMDAHCTDCVTIGRRSFPLAEGFDAFADGLSELFPTQRDGLRSYALLLADCARGDADGAGSMPWLADVSAYDYLQSTFTDPLLIDVLSGASMKMEMRRKSLPLFAFAHTMAGFVESSWRLAGDGSMIVQALADGIRADGGEIVVDSEVERLEGRGDRALRVVCRDGRAYEGRRFVSTLHPQATCQMAERGGFSLGSFGHRMAMLESTMGMFTASLRLRPGAIRYSNSNHYVYRHAGVWQPVDAAKPVDRVMVSFRVPTDGSEYACQIDLLTPMPWVVCEPWAATSVGHRGDGYVAMKRRWAGECVALAERVVPGLGAAVEECHTSTPLTYRDYTLTPHGSAFGVRKDCRSPLTTMMSPRTPIANLLMAGQSVMLHGLHGVTMTSLAVCDEILGKDGRYSGCM